MDSAHSTDVQPEGERGARSRRVSARKTFGDEDFGRNGGSSATGDDDGGRYAALDNQRPQRVKGVLLMDSLNSLKRQPPRQLKKPQTTRKPALPDPLPEAAIVPFVGELDGSPGPVVPLQLTSGVHLAASRLVRALCSPAFRRWIRAEFLYSGIDRGFFLRNDFVECLAAPLGLAHVTRLTRTEWGVVRSQMGRPRLLSRRFLAQERDKLERYRADVRRMQLGMDPEAPFPHQLIKPYAVGTRVSAVHPKTRAICTGFVLLADPHAGSCRVQFDREGAARVPDTEVFPHGPLQLIYQAPTNIPLRSADSTSGSNAVMGGGGAGAEQVQNYYVPHDPWQLGSAAGPDFRGAISAALTMSSQSNVAGLSAVSSMLGETAVAPVGATAPASITMHPRHANYTMGTTSVGTGAAPFPTYGQPVRIGISEEADLVLHAYSSLALTDRDGHPIDAATRMSLARGSGGLPPAVPGLTSLTSSLLLLQRSPSMASDSGSSASAAVPAATSAPADVPLSHLGPASTTFMSFAAHCATVMATVRAEQAQIAVQLSNLIAAKSRLLKLATARRSQLSAAAASQDQELQWIMSSVRSLNGSIELHVRSLRRLSRVHTQATEGADTAVMTSGLYAPPPQPAAHVLSGATPPSSSATSPFVAVAVSSARAFASDPTARSVSSPLLPPGAAERLDAHQLRAQHKSQRLMARSLRESLVKATAAESADGAADANATAAAEARVLSLASKPAFATCAAALQLEYALQAAGVGAGTTAPALESFVAVNRALQALKPVHGANLALYNDCVSVVASLRAATVAL